VDLAVRLRAARTRNDELETPQFGQLTHGEAVERIIVGDQRLWNVMSREYVFEVLEDAISRLACELSVL